MQSIVRVDLSNIKPMREMGAPLHANPIELNPLSSIPRSVSYIVVKHRQLCERMSPAGLWQGLAHSPPRTLSLKCQYLCVSSSAAKHLYEQKNHVATTFVKR